MQKAIAFVMVIGLCVPLMAARGPEGVSVNDKGVEGRQGESSSTDWYLDGMTVRFHPSPTGYKVMASSSGGRFDGAFDGCRHSTAGEVCTDAAEITISGGYFGENFSFGGRSSDEKGYDKCNFVIMGGTFYMRRMSLHRGHTVKIRGGNFYFDPTPYLDGEQYVAVARGTVPESWAVRDREETSDRTYTVRYYSVNGDHIYEEQTVKLGESVTLLGEQDLEPSSSTVEPEPVSSSSSRVASSSSSRVASSSSSRVASSSSVRAVSSSSRNLLYSPYSFVPSRLRRTTIDNTPVQIGWSEVAGGEHTIYEVGAEARPSQRSGVVVKLYPVIGQKRGVKVNGLDIGFAGGFPDDDNWRADGDTQICINDFGDYDIDVSECDARYDGEVVVAALENRDGEAVLINVIGDRAGNDFHITDMRETANIVPSDYKVKITAADLNFDLETSSPNRSWYAGYYTVEFYLDWTIKQRIFKRNRVYDLLAPGMEDLSIEYFRRKGDGRLYDPGIQVFNLGERGDTIEFEAQLK